MRLRTKVKSQWVQHWQMVMYRDKMPYTIVLPAASEMLKLRATLTPDRPTDICDPGLEAVTSHAKLMLNFLPEKGCRWVTFIIFCTRWASQKHWGLNVYYCLWDGRTHQWVRLWRQMWETAGQWVLGVVSWWSLDVRGGQAYSTQHGSTLTWGISEYPIAIINGSSARFRFDIG